MIAHHLKTIRGADQIIVFNKGKIVEKGTHQMLIGKKWFVCTIVAIAGGSKGMENRVNNF